METKDIIQRILSLRKDLTRERVLEMIEERRRIAKGFLTRKAAARIIASELGVAVPWEPLPSEIPIRNLVSGLSDVTVVGRVIIVYPPRTFNRPDGTLGRVGHLLIADGSGTLGVVLWGDKASLVEAGEIKQGQLLRISHGYVREGLNGELELHVGARGEIEISPPDVTESEYPPITHFFHKVKDITRKHKRANVLGVVRSVYPVSEFQREDETTGKVMRVELEDETGQIMAVFWNEKVDQLGKVKRGDYIQIMNAKVRERFDGKLELHAEGITQIQVFTEKPPPELAPPPALQLKKVGELEPNLRSVNVLARVIHVGKPREFKKPSGEVAYVSTLLVGDETGAIRLNLWEDKATFAEKIRQGDVILIEGAYTRERFGRVTLNLGRRGNLLVNPSIARELPSYENKVTIANIREEIGPITVEGSVATAPTVREVTTSRGEKIRVASFELIDETGRINVSLWRELAEFAKELEVGTRIIIRNVYVRRDVSGEVELTSGLPTSVEVASKEPQRES